MIVTITSKSSTGVIDGEAFSIHSQMRRVLFDYVEHIRNAQKYFDYSRVEIQRALLAKGECHLPIEHDLTDEFGNTFTAQLYLNVKTRSETPLGWTMSLKLHEMRIDCVDYESKFPAADGSIGHGWHRHQWDPVLESAERSKVPIDNFHGVATTEEFLVRGLSLLKIRTNAADHGQDLLFA